MSSVDYGHSNALNNPEQTAMNIPHDTDPDRSHHLIDTGHNLSSLPAPKSDFTETIENAATTFTEHVRPVTCWQRIAPIHTQQANPKPWWILVIFPFRLITFPAIIWTGILSGIQIMWLSLLSDTQSEIFDKPPCNFSTAAVGDSNVAAFVGAIFGMLWGGPLSDWYIQCRARPNIG
jgi:hypothetical protein